MSQHKADMVQAAVAGFVSISLGGMSFMDWLAAGEKALSMTASVFAIAFVIYKWIKHVRHENRRDRRVGERPPDLERRRVKSLEAWADKARPFWEGSAKKWREQVRKTKARLKRNKK